jgi:hypothetical protein
MKVENKSTNRAYHLHGKMIKPGETVDFNFDVSADIKDLSELVGFDIENGDAGVKSDKPKTAADLKEALDAMGVKYPSNASKGDLQDLYDSAQIAAPVALLDSQE